MNIILFILVALVFPAQLLRAQSSDLEKVEEHQEKIDLILRMQDTRTIHDGKLISFFTDRDPLIRARAVLACGSIQDTALIPLVLDRLSQDPDERVQAAAAFAIGQTAGQLPESQREVLGHDLLWSRFQKIGGAVRERLAEELGKFGNGQTLLDLVNHAGTLEGGVRPEVVAMSIARFAIRGVVRREAVQYLLSRVRPEHFTPWEIIYALQRIGNHPEIRSNLDSLALLLNDNDPYVRMNLASLLGTVKDEKRCLELLGKLAKSDADWRVRVNALKALSNYDLRGSGEIIRTFHRTFFAENTILALAAVSAFGNSGLKKNGAHQPLQDAFSALERIALNNGDEYRWQLQGEAATAAAKLEGTAALAVIRPAGLSRPELQGQLLVAIGMTGARGAAETLLKFENNDSPVLYRSALDGLLELCRMDRGDTVLVKRTYDCCISALAARDVAVVATAASILGDTLFLVSHSLPSLVQALSQLNAPDGIEAMVEIISTLGKLKDLRAITILHDQLERRDRSLAVAAATALRSITGRDYTSEIPRSLEPVYTDFDFQYLTSLADTVRVTMETIRGDVHLELYRDVAPFTVMSFLKLALDRGFYRRLPFHRIVPNFVVQGGDPRGDGWGGPGYSIRSEFSPLSYETGTLGMASSGKDTEGSQFFITQSPQPHLDGRYTIFGKVISGIDVVARLEPGDQIIDFSVERGGR